MKLLDAMYSIVSAEGQQLRLQLHPEHEIYQAHFPGNPITPGVCQVQIVAELAGRQLQRHLTLHKVVNLKFTAPVSPVETPLIDVTLTSLSEAEDCVKVKGTIAAAGTGTLMTKFSLEFKS
jgi:3-hydroxyacyl-[acyl-carrier-protein] dehydratase